MCQYITCKKHLQNPIKNLHLKCLAEFWMYFAKIFRKPFPNHLCLSTFLDMQFQTMPSQVTLSSVFRLGLKVLRSTFNYLYLFEHIFLQVQVVCKDYFHYRGSFSKKKKPKKKTSGVIIVCSGFEKVYFIYNWKEMIGNSLTKH